jgi:hydroxyquinol 1,2-dioxygenase
MEYGLDEHVAEVTSRYAETPDPRLRTIMESLTRHLLAFADEVDLTRDEWLTGLGFLTDTGKKSDEVRLEMMLLSDLLGLSALIDIIEDRGSDAVTDGAEPTDGTLLGPFYFPDAPRRGRGESVVVVDDPSEPLRVTGTVQSTDGSPIGGALLEIWQNGGDGLYTVQDLDRFPMEHLRGTYETDADGSYEISCLRPVDYPVPMDGPPGDMLRATNREGMRAAHLHLLITAPGHRSLVTEIFDTQSERLDRDVVFGVRPSLVRTPTAGADGMMETTFDVVLRPV